MNHVMDKDGNRITSYVYDDWNEYIVSKILVRYGLPTSYRLQENYKVILSEEYKKTECKYETLYNILPSDDEDSGEESDRDEPELSDVKSVITDDTLYIWKNILESYSMWNTSKQLDQEKIDQSVLILTEGFEKNPIKAFIRVRYFHENPKLFQQVLDVYWIYFFSCFCHPETNVPESKVNIRKAREYLKLFDMNEAGEYQQNNKLIDCGEYLEEYYKKEIEKLKEEHQKEIEELLAPNGAAYTIVKERFEKMQKDTELN